MEVTLGHTYRWHATTENYRQCFCPSQDFSHTVIPCVCHSNIIMFIEYIN